MIGWIASGISILGIILNAKRNIVCWPVWLLSNILWVYLAIQNNDYPQIILWSAFASGNIYGWLEWSKMPKPIVKTKAFKKLYREAFPND